MEKEKKLKQPPADAAAPPGDEGEGRSERKGKKARKEKAEAILPSQIKDKDKHREVHAKLKRQKKAQKRGQAARRTEELLALDPKLNRVLTRIYELCRYTAEQSHELRCDLHEMKSHLNIASDPPPPLPTFPDPFEESEIDYEDDGNGGIDYDSEE